MEFHHIGIAVNSIEIYYNEILKPLFDFNTLSNIITNQSQNVRVAFAENAQSIRIELIEAINEKSPVIKILRRNNGGLYHLGFTSYDFDNDIDKLKRNGFYLFSNKEGIAFLTSPNFEIYEVINGVIN